MATAPMGRLAGGAPDPARELVRICDADRQRSWRARQKRLEKNRDNWAMYWGEQDWTHKRKGQSTEFLPDFPVAIEQLAGVIARSVIDFSDWLDVEPVGLGPVLMDPETMRALLLYLLGRLKAPGYGADTAVPFAAVLADGVKLGLLEAVLTVKVMPADVERPIFRLERGQPTGPSIDPDNPVPPADDYGVVVGTALAKTFRLAIEPIPYEDYWPDPTGAGRYVIHEVTRTLAELRENPDYDPDALDRLRGLAGDTETRRDKQQRTGEPFTWTEDGEPTVRVRERWGDVVDARTGTLQHRNVVYTTAGPELLRPVTPNPLWHGRWPIISTPLVRVPLSTVHKALADHASPMAKAVNELFNLMLDGGYAATWGTRQLRPEMMAHPEEVADGIPQGYTAVLNPNQPPGATFLERVDEGQVPQYAAYMFEQGRAAFQSAIATPDTGLGKLPPRQAKATAIVQAAQSSASLFDAISGLVELTGLGPIVELAWLTTWQYLDDFTTPELVQVVGAERAMLLESLTPEERFVLLAQAATFKVSGLQQLGDRARTVQGYLATLQAIGTNPALAAVFDQEYDARKLFGLLLKGLGVDPAKLRKHPDIGQILDPRLVLAGARTGNFDALLRLGGLEPEPAAGPLPPGDLELGMGPPNAPGLTGPGGGAESPSRVRPRGPAGALGPLR